MRKERRIEPEAVGGDNNRPDNSFVFSRARGYSLGTVYREYRASTERIYRRLPANWNREFESAAAKWESG